MYKVARKGDPQSFLFLFMRDKHFSVFHSFFLFLGIYFIFLLFIRCNEVVREDIHDEISQ